MSQAFLKMHAFKQKIQMEKKINLAANYLQSFCGENLEITICIVIINMAKDEGQYVSVNQRI